MLSIYFLLQQVWSLNSKNCSSFVCGNQITTGDCISVSESAITVTGCAAGYYCDLTQLYAYTNPNLTNVGCKQQYNSINPCSISVTDQPTGFPCCSDNDCLSNSCSSSICSGRSEGSNCRFSFECKSNYYCNQGKCSQINKKLDDACTTDYECPIGATCNLAKCVKIFSLDIGSEANSTKACSSNIISSGKCDFVIPDLNSKYDYSCYIGSNCDYKFGNSGAKVKSSICLCSGDGGAKGYCGEYGMNSQNSSRLMNELQYSDSICSGEHAHSTDAHILYICESINYDKYYKYNQYSGQLLYYNIYKSHSLDQCALSIGLFDPIYSFEPQKDSLDILKLSAIILTLILG